MLLFVCELRKCVLCVFKAKCDDLMRMYIEQNFVTYLVKLWYRLRGQIREIWGKIKSTSVCQDSTKVIFVSQDVQKNQNGFPVIRLRVGGCNFEEKKKWGSVKVTVTLCNCKLLFKDWKWEMISLLFDNANEWSVNACKLAWRGGWANVQIWGH